MFTVLETLFLRRPKIHYTAPPVCDADFSSSGGPSIVFNDIGALSSPTGVALGGVGGFFLSWNSYPGALCYSIYKSTNPDDPSGTYTVIMECLPNPPVDLSTDGPGWFRVSAITPDGETPLSQPVHVGGGGGGFTCPTIDGPPPAFEVDATDGDVDVILGPFPVSEGAGAGIVTYEWFKDGVFFLDTTDTSKSFLQFDEVSGTDTGAYTLHLNNDQPSCSLVSDPIVLDVASECGTPAYKIAGYGPSLVASIVALMPGATPSALPEWDGILRFDGSQYTNSPSCYSIGGFAIALTVVPAVVFPWTLGCSPSWTDIGSNPCMWCGTHGYINGTITRDAIDIFDGPDTVRFASTNGSGVTGDYGRYHTEPICGIFIGDPLYTITGGPNGTANASIDSPLFTVTTL